MGCASLTAGLDPGCSALKKVSGVDRRVYVFETPDVDPAVITFGTNGEITAFGLLTGKTLKPFIGKKEKHSAKSTLQPGENVNTFLQEVPLVLYEFTAAERKAIDDLFKSEDLGVIVETNAGQLEVYGLSNQNVGSVDNYGLKSTAGETTTGILVNDDNSVKITLGGTLLNRAVLYKPASTLSANITELDGMSV